MRTFLSVYLRILPRQKTYSRHVTDKCVIAGANSIGLPLDIQNNHLFVLTTSSEYMYFLLVLGLAWSKELGDFKEGEVVTLRLNFRLKSSCQYLWTVRCGNAYTTTLSLEV